MSQHEYAKSLDIGPANTKFKETREEKTDQANSLNFKNYFLLVEI